MNKKLLIFFLSSLFLLTLVFGCQQAAKKTEEVTPKEKVTPKETKKEMPVTIDNPLKVDTENKKVYVYAEVNAKYFSEPTRHGIVFKDGTNGPKAILKAYAKALDFHDALIKIGAKPGNNVTKESPPGTIVQGDVLNVKVSWGNKEYNWSDIIIAEPDKGWEIRFGGNYERQKTLNTGCILCLDSCAAGITSNAKWGWKSFDEGKVKFFGNKEILPPDGTGVVVTFSLK